MVLVKEGVRACMRLWMGLCRGLRSWLIQQKCGARVEHLHGLRIIRCILQPEAGDGPPLSSG